MYKKERLFQYSFFLNEEFNHFRISDLLKKKTKKTMVLAVTF